MGVCASDSNSVDTVHPNAPVRLNNVQVAFADHGSASQAASSNSAAQMPPPSKLNGTEKKGSEGLETKAPPAAAAANPMRPRPSPAPSSLASPRGGGGYGNTAFAAKLTRRQEKKDTDESDPLQSGFLEFEALRRDIVANNVKDVLIDDPLPLTDDRLLMLCQDLMGCTSVTSLYLDHTSISAKGLQALCNLLTAKNRKCNIVDLSVADTHIDADSCGPLALLLESNLCSLQCLYMEENTIEDAGAVYMGQALSRNNTLLGLSLATNGIARRGGQALGAGLQLNHCLTELDLSYNRLGDTGCAALCDGLMQNTTLQALILMQNDITSLSASNVWALLSCPKTALVNLVLFGNAITCEDSEAATAQQALSTNTCLTQFGLDGNLLGDRGVSVIFAALQGNTGITSVHLGRNGITDQGLKGLRQLLAENETLTTLDLTENPIVSFPLDVALCPQLGLQRLFLDCKTLVFPPRHVVANDESGLKAIKYFADLRTGASPLTNIKVMIVGHGGAGKTTLKRKALMQAPILKSDILSWSTADVQQWAHHRDLSPFMCKLLHENEISGRVLSNMQEMKEQLDAISKEQERTSGAPLPLRERNKLLNEVELLHKQADLARVDNEWLYVSSVGIERDTLSLPLTAADTSSSPASSALSSQALNTHNSSVTTPLTLQLQLLDFAGQSEYYVSHQLFLTDLHAVYVVVTQYMRPRKTIQTPFQRKRKVIRTDFHKLKGLDVAAATEDDDVDPTNVIVEMEEVEENEAHDAANEEKQAVNTKRAKGRQDLVAIHNPRFVMGLYDDDEGDALSSDEEEDTDESGHANTALPAHKASAVTRTRTRMESTPSRLNDNALAQRPGRTTTVMGHSPISPVSSHRGSSTYKVNRRYRDQWSYWLSFLRALFPRSSSVPTVLALTHLDHKGQFPPPDETHDRMVLQHVFSPPLQLLDCVKVDYNDVAQPPSSSAADEADDGAAQRGEDRLRATVFAAAKKLALSTLVPRSYLFALSRVTQLTAQLRRDKMLPVVRLSQLTNIITSPHAPHAHSSLHNRSDSQQGSEDEALATALKNGGPELLERALDYLQGVGAILRDERLSRVVLDPLSWFSRVLSTFVSENRLEPLIKNTQGVCLLTDIQAHAPELNCSDEEEVLVVMRLLEKVELCFPLYAEDPEMVRIATTTEATAAATASNTSTTVTSPGATIARMSTITATEPGVEDVATATAPPSLDRVVSYTKLPTAFLFPCLLPDIHPALHQRLWFLSFPTATEPNAPPVVYIGRRFATDRTDHIPPAFFPSLQHRLRQQYKTQCQLRKGFIIVHKPVAITAKSNSSSDSAAMRDIQALITMDRTHRRLEVIVRGERDKRVYILLMELFLLIAHMFAKYDGLDIQVSALCIACMQQMRRAPCSFPLERYTPPAKGKQADPQQAKSPRQTPIEPIDQWVFPQTPTPPQYCCGRAHPGQPKEDELMGPTLLFFGIPEKVKPSPAATATTAAAAVVSPSSDAAVASGPSGAPTPVADAGASGDVATRQQSHTYDSMPARAAADNNIAASPTASPVVPVSVTRTVSPWPIGQPLRPVEQKNMEPIEYLSQGRFSWVFKAQLNNHPVAIKVAKQDAVNFDPSQWEEIQRFLLLPPHPNVVPLLGLVRKFRTLLPESVGGVAEGQLCLILPFANGSSLSDVIKMRRAEHRHQLRSQQQQQQLAVPSSGLASDSAAYSTFSPRSPRPEEPPALSALEIVNFSLDVAHGVQHLHSEHIVHRDIAIRNLLLYDNRACISDFGLARRVDPVHLHHRRIHKESLPVRSTPPESLQRAEHSFRSDVWMIGVTMWEMMSGGQHPYPHIPDDQDVITGVKSNTLSLAQCLKSLPEQHRPESLVRVVERCVQLNPEDRPEVSELIDMLEDCKRELA